MLEEEKKAVETPIEPSQTPTPQPTPQIDPKPPVAPAQTSNSGSEELRRVKRELEELRAEKQGRIEEEALKKSGVRQEYFEDFKNLAKINKNATEKDISEKAIELKKKFPSMFEGQKVNNFKSAAELKGDSSDFSPKAVRQSHDLKKGEIMYGQIGD